MTPGHMSNILNISKQYAGYGISAMERAVSQSILKGRPYGGVATLVHIELLQNTKCLKCSERFNILCIGNTIFY